MLNKLYVCQDENGILSIQTRFDVDSVISSAEQFEGNMPFTVLGGFDTEQGGIPYLIAAKIGTNIVVYDVVKASSEEHAETIFLEKKRNKGKDISIKHVRDLSNLVKEYFS